MGNAGHLQFRVGRDLDSVVERKAGDDGRATGEVRREESGMRAMGGRMDRVITRAHPCGSRCAAVMCPSRREEDVEDLRNMNSTMESAVENVVDLERRLDVRVGTCVRHVCRVRRWVEERAGPQERRKKHEMRANAMTTDSMDVFAVICGHPTLTVSFLDG